MLQTASNKLSSMDKYKEVIKEIPTLVLCKMGKL